jgi:hypothetical protein
MTAERFLLETARLELRPLGKGHIEPLHALWTDAPNVASVRVLERLGFTLDRRAAIRGLDTLFFRHARAT